MEQQAPHHPSVPIHWDKVFGTVTKLFVWLLLLGVLYLLRSFFLLIFLTFVFAYIQSRAVDRLQPRIRHRTLRTVIVGVAFLALVIGVFSFIVPSVAGQARAFAGNYSLYLRSIDTQIEVLARDYPLIQNYLPESKSSGNWTPEGSTFIEMAQRFTGFDESSDHAENVKHAFEAVRKIGSHIVGAVSAFLLSLLFSFLIVLDLERLTASVRGLERTKVAFIYHEVAPSICNFGRVLGQALEAQFFIALVNTILTAIGLWLLGISGKMALLSMIVFLCSFIPIAGVFISSVPICLVTLQGGGLGLMFLSILLITAIHLIECYGLNPKIFGHHLRLNPVFVMIVLTISGKLFGVWGLVLALPICTYIFRTAIRYQEADEGETVAQAET